MPELPEVQTVVSMLQQQVIGTTIEAVQIHRRDLRWPIPTTFEGNIQGKTIVDVTRRSKYMLLWLNPGVMIVHLGMSGQIKLQTSTAMLAKHDHVVWHLGERVMRYCDPRRFGSVLYFDTPDDDRRLDKLGPEPLSDDFHADYLFAACRHRRVPIKQRIMDAQCVVGVGNIYANESLFLAGIDPRHASGDLSMAALARLVDAIRSVLQKAIAQGGTTLKDFKHLDGKAGYFQQTLFVYGRQDQPCRLCKTTLKGLKMSGRQTVMCPQCQS